MNMTLPLPQPTELHTVPSDNRSLNTSSNTNYTTLPPSPFIPCDNPRNVISPAVADTVELIVYAGIFPVLVICGVITNVINMAVFRRQGLSHRIHVCLFSLALTDTGYLVFLMCSKSYTLVGLVDPEAGAYWQQRHLAVAQGSYLSCLAVSNTVTAIIAAERCLCVLSPLKAARFFKTKYLKILIAVAAICILVVKNTALFIKYQTVHVTSPHTNTSTFVSRLSPFYRRHKVIIDIIYLYPISVAIPIISLFIVIVCTTATIFHLRVTASWRRRSVCNMTSVEKQEVSVTRMLVMVCCVYVVCMTPSVTRLFVYSLVPGFPITGFLCNTYRVSIACILMLEAVNASVNFLVYVKQSSQYRSTLRQLLCGGEREVKKGNLNTAH